MPNTTTDKIDFKLIKSGLILFAVLLTLNLIISYIPNLIGKKDASTLDKIEENTKVIKNALSPFEAKDKMNKVIIDKDFSNTVINEQPTNTISKQLSVSGPFNNGYLYVKTSIDNQAIGENGSIYTKLTVQANDGNYRELGGHLITSKSLNAPTSNQFTELLFPLSDIKYKKDYRDSDIEVISADWLKLLNIIGTQRIISFVSTVHQGKIIEMSIFYECATGQECNINVVQ